MMRRYPFPHGRAQRCCHAAESRTAKWPGKSEPSRNFAHRHLRLPPLQMDCHAGRECGLHSHCLPQAAGAPLEAGPSLPDCFAVCLSWLLLIRLLLLLLLLLRLLLLLFAAMSPGYARRLAVSLHWSQMAKPVAAPSVEGAPAQDTPLAPAAWSDLWGLGRPVVALLALLTLLALLALLVLLALLALQLQLLLPRLLPVELPVLQPLLWPQPLLLFLLPMSMLLPFPVVAVQSGMVEQTAQLREGGNVHAGRVKQLLCWYACRRCSLRCSHCERR